MGISTPWLISKRSVSHDLFEEFVRVRAYEIWQSKLSVNAYGDWLTALNRMRIYHIDPNDPRHPEVQKVAYEVYLERRDQCKLADWSQAESEISRIYEVVS